MRRLATAWFTVWKAQADSGEGCGEPPTARPGASSRSRIDTLPRGASSAGGRATSPPLVLHWQASRVKSAGRRGGSAPTPGYPSPLLDVPTHRERKKNIPTRRRGSHVVRSWTPGLRSPSSQGFRPVRAAQVYSGMALAETLSASALTLRFSVSTRLSLWIGTFGACRAGEARAAGDWRLTHTHGHGCLTVFHLYAVNFTRTGPIHPGFTCVNS